MSSPNAISYQQAMRDFNTAHSEVVRLAMHLREFADAMLRTPGETLFASVDGEPEPPLAQLASGRPWDATLFPEPIALQAALRRRKLALLQQRRIYAQLHPTARNRCPPPPAT